eukprot:747058-Hanusia_phi.AAC.2
MMRQHHLLRTLDTHGLFHPCVLVFPPLPPALLLQLSLLPSCSSALLLSLFPLLPQALPGPRANSRAPRLPRQAPRGRDKGRGCPAGQSWSVLEPELMPLQANLCRALCVLNVQEDDWKSRAMAARALLGLW